ncbi:Uncharacterised protein [uncultured archaeon]|nr:Uncharacterised protein [uncultured archaeon]
MDERIEPNAPNLYSGDNLETQLRNEGKQINFCRRLTVSPFDKIAIYHHPFCTTRLGIYSQKGERGIFVRDEEGRELHLKGRYTSWWPANPFILGGEEGIDEDCRVKAYGLPKLHGGIGMELIGETFYSPVSTHEERAIIVFSFMKNSRTYVKRHDWKWETKDPDDAH